MVDKKTKKEDKTYLIFEILVIFFIIFIIFNYISINENSSDLKKVEINKSYTSVNKLEQTTTKLQNKVISSFEKTSNIKFQRLNSTQNNILKIIDNSLKKFKLILGFKEVEVEIPNTITSIIIN